MSTAEQILQEAANSFGAVVTVAEQVDGAAQMIVSSLQQGGKVFFCGNGGSAGDAQHLEAEFLVRFLNY